MTTIYDKKRKNVLQFSAKKFWGIFYVSKKRQKKCKADKTGLLYILRKYRPGQ